MRQPKQRVCIGAERPRAARPQPLSLSRECQNYPKSFAAPLCRARQRYACLTFFIILTTYLYPLPISLAFSLEPSVSPQLQLSAGSVPEKPLLPFNYPP